MVDLSISLNSLKRIFEKSQKLFVLLIGFIPFTNSFFLNVLRYSETLYPLAHQTLAFLNWFGVLIKWLIYEWFLLF